MYKFMYSCMYRSELLQNYMLYYKTINNDKIFFSLSLKNSYLNCVSLKAYYNHGEMENQLFFIISISSKWLLAIYTFFYIYHKLLKFIKIKEIV